MTTPWTQALGGLVIGYVAASLIESSMHQWVSDAPGPRVRFWRRWPRLFRLALETHYSHHTIHHYKTFRQDYVTQFRNDAEREALDRELAAHGRHGELIRRAKYAVKLQGEGGWTFVAPLLLFMPFIYLLLGPWAVLASLPTMALPPLLSNYVHPYLHMAHERARAEAPPFVRWFLGTWYARAMARNHFIHHRYGGTSNFNLVLGGDLLRGVARRASERDYAVMQRIGLRCD